MPSTAVPWRFVKGHGTENDFVVLPDPDGQLDVPPALVRALCDRRTGIGGDGLLRVVRTARVAEGLGLDGEWFMDYRNADGSLAEMCGNGARVFARYLVAAGLAEPGRLVLATRGGSRFVDVPVDGDVSVGMGPAVIGGEMVVEVAGRPFAGIAVSVGNPHLVCGTVLPVGELDLSDPPLYDPAAFPAGVNVEVVNVLGSRTGRVGGTDVPPAPDGFDLHVRMRVYERGVGETRSCGTGAVAVAAVALRTAGIGTGRVAVDVPGGHLAVEVSADDSVLSGPAVLVAAGDLAPDWLAGVTPVRPEAVSDPLAPAGAVLAGTAAPGHRA